MTAGSFLFVAHRINTVEELKKIPPEVGVEIDLRDREQRLILQHDPFLDGEDFEKWLETFNHAFIILNIKSERIEYRILELLKEHKIENFFFLDSSFPVIRELSRKGERRIALRFSEYEGLDTLEAMKGQIEWVWVDCFTKFPLDENTYRKIKNLGYRICIVSPELQGRENELPGYRDYLHRHGFEVDMVCSKIRNFHLWRTPCT